MATLTLTAANQCLAWIFGGTATPPTGDMKVALVTANGDATTPGAEVTGGSYIRKTLTAATIIGGATSNATDVVWSGMPACTVVGIEIWDSAATPVRWIYTVAGASKTYDQGDDCRLAAGALSVTLS